VSVLSFIKKAALVPDDRKAVFWKAPNNQSDFHFSPMFLIC